MALKSDQMFSILSTQDRWISYNFFENSQYKGQSTISPITNQPIGTDPEYVVTIICAHVSPFVSPPLVVFVGTDAKQFLKF
jgi:hypothetical protein